MSRKVEMVRMAPDDTFSERLDRERSAAEVFGSAKKVQKVDQATIDKALEGKTTKFVSESELLKNKQQHGGSIEDGTFSGRSLTEAIIAQREAKEQKFQDDWKTMKQGKNRPLEEDEVEFLNGLAKEQALREKRQREEEKKLMQRMEEIQKSATPAVHGSLPSNAAQKQLRPAAKRRIVVRQNPAPPTHEPQPSTLPTGDSHLQTSSRPEEAAGAAGGSPPVVGAGLVSGYDSSGSEE